MPRSDDTSKNQPLGTVIEMPDDAGKLQSFDDLSTALEHVLKGVVLGLASTGQAQACIEIIKAAREALVSKAQYQAALDAIAAHNDMYGERRVANGGIQAPTLIRGGKTGSPFKLP
jgi:hypothetical protein